MIKKSWSRLSVVRQRSGSPNSCPLSGSQAWQTLAHNHCHHHHPYHDHSPPPHHHLFTSLWIIIRFSSFVHKHYDCTVLLCTLSSSSSSSWIISQTFHNNQTILHFCCCANTKGAVGGQNENIEVATINIFADLSILWNAYLNVGGFNPYNCATTLTLRRLYLEPPYLFRDSAACFPCLAVGIMSLSSS